MVSLIYNDKFDRKNAGFRVAICGGCGHMQMYTWGYEEILERNKNGYVSKELK